MNSFKGIFQGRLRTTPNITSAEKIYWDVFLSKTASLTRNLILKSLKSFLVLSLFETIVEYICNNPFLFSKLWLVETAVHRCFIEQLLNISGKSRKRICYRTTFYYKGPHYKRFPENSLESFKYAVFSNTFGYLLPKETIPWSSGLLVIILINAVSTHTCITKLQSVGPNNINGGIRGTNKRKIWLLNWKKGKKKNVTEFDLQFLSLKWT